MMSTLKMCITTEAVQHHKKVLERGLGKICYKSLNSLLRRMWAIKSMLVIIVFVKLDTFYCTQMTL